MKYLLIILFLASCYTPKFGVAKAKVTITKKGINIQPMEKFRPIKDTVMEVYLIQRIRKN